MSAGDSYIIARLDLTPTFLAMILQSDSQAAQYHVTTIQHTFSFITHRPAPNLLQMLAHAVAIPLHSLAMRS